MKKFINFLKSLQPKTQAEMDEEYISDATSIIDLELRMKEVQKRRMERQKPHWMY